MLLPWELLLLPRVPCDPLLLFGLLWSLVP